MKASHSPQCITIVHFPWLAFKDFTNLLANSNLFINHPYSSHLIHFPLHLSPYKPHFSIPLIIIIIIIIFFFNLTQFLFHTGFYGDRLRYPLAGHVHRRPHQAAEEHQCPLHHRHQFLWWVESSQQCRLPGPSRLR